MEIASPVPAKQFLDLFCAMEISIEYCVTCNYRPIAAGLAIRIKAATGVTPMLMPSNDAGAYEIKLDGRVIFSKKETGRFPSHAEILDMLPHSS